MPAATAMPVTPAGTQPAGVLLFCGTDIFLPAPPGGTAGGAFGGISGGASSVVPGGTPGLAFDVFPALPAVPAERARAFEFDGALWSALSLDEEEAVSLPGGAFRMPVRLALAEFAEPESRLILKGLALANWTRTANFCGACGAPLLDGSGTDSGGRVCSSCRRPYFPRISPAVIVLIKKGEQVLLAHNAKFPPDRFGLIAGFVEVGETLEETVRREVREETGIEVRNLRYLRSQPWPFPDSLMLAFEADYASGEARPDGEEITELRWCGRDGMPDLPPPGSVARSLIDGFFGEIGPSAT